MNLELKKENVKFEKLISKNITQTMIEGDIIVPDVKPDINKILQAEGKVTLDNKKIVDRKILFSGSLNINILYLSENNNKPIHSMVGNLPIEDFVNVDDINEDVDVSIKISIEYINTNLLNSRKLNVKCLLASEIKIKNNLAHEIVYDIVSEHDIQVKRKPIKLTTTVAKRNENINVKDELAIPNGKANIDDILKYNIQIINQDIKLLNDKAMVKGELCISTLYSAEGEDGIEFIENEIPFNSCIPLKCIKEDMFYDSKLYIDYENVYLKPDDDGESRVIAIDLCIVCSIKVMNTEIIDTIEDLYLPNYKTSIKYKQLCSQNIVCQNKNVVSMIENIDIDSEYNIMQIYHVYANPKIEETSILDDKIVVEGTIECTLLYVAEDDTNPISTYDTTIPFKQVLETKGAHEDMVVDVCINIEGTSFNMLSQKEVEVRFMSMFNAIVYSNKQYNTIEEADIEEYDEEYYENEPSMSIYVVKTGDSLWKLAKKYNTTIEQIAELNDIEDIDNIDIGQKLIILKKCR